MGKDACIKQLKELTGQRYILIVKRGNTAIRLAIKLVKELGYTKALVQNQGGWLTYKQFCGKEKIPCVELETYYGLVDPKSLEEHKESVLLINSMPAYAALQDMEAIAKVCERNKIFIINDVSGSIGTKQSIIGDVILGSFGNDKPVNLGEGGFIATNDEAYMGFLEKNTEATELDFKGLDEAFCDLDERMVALATKRKKLLEALKAEEGLGKNIIHSDREGINVIVKFSDDKEKERLINIAEDNKVEYTLCPRDIRIKDKAVCFEIKRLK